MKVYLGKQESISGVPVPVENGADEYTKLSKMIKLSVYVKREDFPDVSQYVEKWMELDKISDKSSGGMDIIAIFRALNENFDTIIALITKQAEMLENGLLKFADNGKELANNSTIEE